MLIRTHDDGFINCDRVAVYYLSGGLSSTRIVARDNLFEREGVVIARYSTYNRAVEEMFKLCEEITKKRPKRVIYVMPNDKEDDNDDDDKKV